MERPIFKPVGTPVEQLDTPSLIVNIEALESNIAAMAGFFKDKKAKLRPHIEVHRTPAIAHKQLAAGGTVGGIAVSTVGQGEVFAQSGFTDVFVGNVIVTGPKIARLCALARQAKVTVAVDSLKNVGDLSEAAVANGVMLNVVVYVHTRVNLLGVEPGKPAVDLARAIKSAPGLNFAGLMSYEGRILPENGNDPVAESKKWAQVVLDTRQDIEKAGIKVDVVSLGNTSNYQTVAAMPGVTEVPAGTYALMDARYAGKVPQFKSAAKVLCTVTSLPEPGLIITDGGQKTIGADTGLPAIDNVPTYRVKGLSAEHGSIFADHAVTAKFKLGDKVWVTPFDMGTCANLHDYIFAARNGKLEAVWNVQARGHYR
ncbi:MAG: DSD1 family PLP-dependent enzyme [SAR202 cluster bacterium]|nr:DSD1 family PLP-dependent enzyme [SAR202 cluster bacterium]